MIILVLFLLGFAAILACPVLLLMDQIYLSAVIGTAGIVIFTCVLVGAGLIGMFGVGFGALCAAALLLFLLGTARAAGSTGDEFKAETRGIPNSPIARSRGTND